jgi:hypothetical protein
VTTPDATGLRTELRMLGAPILRILPQEARIPASVERANDTSP